MIMLIFFFVLLWDEAQSWGFKDGVLRNSIWLVAQAAVPDQLLAAMRSDIIQEGRPVGILYSVLLRNTTTLNCFDPTERAAGVYHRESRAGKYQLTYAEAKIVCEYEGGQLATYQQMEAARKIGFHLCAAGWMAKGRVGYPIVKARPNCGFGKTGIVDYGIRLNRSERWDAYCYNPHAKECGGIFTGAKHIFKSPGYPNEYENEQICYWHIRLKYGQRIHLQFLDFDVEDDTACMADFLEVYDSYDDVTGFVGRYCGDELPDDIISTGNLMTIKFLSDASVTAGGFQIKYVAIDPPSKPNDEKNTTSQGNTNFLAGKFGIM